MLPILVLIGLGWLAWVLTRHGRGFSGKMALLLDDGEVHRGPLSLLTGRSSATGTFEGWPVIVDYQRANEHQTGYVIVSMRTAGRAVESRVSDSDSGPRVDDRTYEAAFAALERTHDLHVEVEGSWLRATWQPTGFFIFPGRFDQAKWRSVLAHMSVAASRRNALAPPTITAVEPRGGSLRHSADHESAVPESRLSPPERRGLGGPLLVTRIAGALMIFVGGSMLAASLTTGLVSQSARSFALATGGFAAIVLASGTIAFVLAGRPLGLFSNEGDRGRSEADAPIPVGGWLWLCLVTLVALPTWMVVRLSPLIGLWRDILRFLDENDVWAMAREVPEVSGVVLFPVAGVLSVPLLELTAAFGIGISAVVLAALLVVRSPAFPRTFLVSTVLLGGLVASTQWAARAVVAFTVVLESEFLTQPGDEQVLAALTRYGETTQAAAHVLTIVVLGFLVWVPVLFRSSRVRVTFRP